MKLSFLKALLSAQPSSDRLLLLMSGTSTSLTLLFFLAGMFGLPWLVPFGIAGVIGSVITMLVGLWDMTGPRWHKQTAWAVLLATITVLVTVFCSVVGIRT